MEDTEQEGQEGEDFVRLPDGIYRDSHNMIRTQDDKLLPDGMYRYTDEDGKEMILLYEGNFLAFGKDWYMEELKRQQ